MMEGLLSQSGYKVAPPVSNKAELADACARYNPDTVVISVTRPDAGLFDTLSGIRNGSARPIVLFAEDDTRKSMERAVAAGVNAYVVMGLSGNRIRAAVDLAVANFGQTEALRSEAAAAKQALDDRKVIERAKGILMKQRHIDEEDAYRLLRERSMSRAQRLVDVARMINDAAEMLVEEQ